MTKVRHWAVVGGILLAGLVVAGCEGEAREPVAWGGAREAEGWNRGQDAHDTRGAAGENRGQDARDTRGEWSGEITLVDCLREAALESASMEAAWLRWQAQGQREAQVTALPEPRVGYAYFIREIETRVGPQRHRVSAMQSFPWLGVLAAKGRMASAGAEAARQEYEQEKLDVFYRVTEAYVQYWHLRRSIEVTGEIASLLEAMESTVQTRYEAGRAEQTALLRVQVERGKVEDRLRSLHARRGAAVAQLNAAMNRPVEAELGWPGGLPAARTEHGEEEVLAMVRAGSPRLAMLGARIEQARAGAELAAKAWGPTTTVGGMWIDTGSAVMEGVPDSGRDPVAVEVQWTLPLWWSAYRAGEVEAKARLRGVEASREAAAQELAAAGRLAWYGYEDAGRQVRLYEEELLPRVRQELAVTQEAFSAGKVGFLDVIDAVRTLLEFELTLVRARADRVERLGALERLAGRELGTGEYSKKEEIGMEGFSSVEAN